MSSKMKLLDPIEPPKIPSQISLYENIGSKELPDTLLSQDTQQIEQILQIIISHFEIDYVDIDKQWEAVDDQWNHLIDLFKKQNALEKIFSLLQSNIEEAHQLTESRRQQSTNLAAFSKGLKRLSNGLSIVNCLPVSLSAIAMNFSSYLNYLNKHWTDKPITKINKQLKQHKSDKQNTNHEIQMLTTSCIENIQQTKDKEHQLHLQIPSKIVNLAKLLYPPEKLQTESWAKEVISQYLLASNSKLTFNEESKKKKSNKHKKKDLSTNQIQLLSKQLLHYIKGYPQEYKQMIQSLWNQQVIKLEKQLEEFMNQTNNQTNEQTKMLNSQKATLKQYEDIKISYESSLQSNQQEIQQNEIKYMQLSQEIVEHSEQFELNVLDKETKLQQIIMNLEKLVNYGKQLQDKYNQELPILNQTIKAYKDSIANIYCNLISFLKNTSRIQTRKQLMINTFRLTLGSLLTESWDEYYLLVSEKNQTSNHQKHSLPKTKSIKFLPMLDEYRNSNTYHEMFRSPVSKESIKTTLSNDDSMKLSPSQLTPIIQHADLIPIQQNLSFIDDEFEIKSPAFLSQDKDEDDGPMVNSFKYLSSDQENNTNNNTTNSLEVLLTPLKNNQMNILFEKEDNSLIRYTPLPSLRNNNDGDDDKWSIQTLSTYETNPSVKYQVLSTTIEELAKLKILLEEKELLIDSQEIFNHQLSDNLSLREFLQQQFQFLQYQQQHMEEFFKNQQHQLQQKETYLFEKLFDFQSIQNNHQTNLFHELLSKFTIIQEQNIFMNQSLQDQINLLSKELNFQQQNAFSLRSSNFRRLTEETQQKLQSEDRSYCDKTVLIAELHNCQVQDICNKEEYIENVKESMKQCEDYLSNEQQIDHLNIDQSLYQQALQPFDSFDNINNIEHQIENQYKQLAQEVMSQGSHLFDVKEDIKPSNIFSEEDDEESEEDIDDEDEDEDERTEIFQQNNKGLELFEKFTQTIELNDNSPLSKKSPLPSPSSLSSISTLSPLGLNVNNNPYYTSLSRLKQSLLNRFWGNPRINLNNKVWKSINDSIITFFQKANYFKKYFLTNASKYLLCSSKDVKDQCQVQDQIDGINKIIDLGSKALLENPQLQDLNIKLENNQDSYLSVESLLTELNEEKEKLITIQQETFKKKHQEKRSNDEQIMDPMIIFPQLKKRTDSLAQTLKSFLQGKKKIAEKWYRISELLKEAIELRCKAKETYFKGDKVNGIRLGGRSFETPGAAWLYELSADKLQLEIEYLEKIEEINQKLTWDIILSNQEKYIIECNKLTSIVNAIEQTVEHFLYIAQQFIQMTLLKSKGRAARQAQSKTFKEIDHCLNDLVYCSHLLLTVLNKYSNEVEGSTVDHYNNISFVEDFRYSAEILNYLSVETLPSMMDLKKIYIFDLKVMMQILNHTIDGYKEKLNEFWKQTDGLKNDEKMNSNIDTNFDYDDEYLHGNLFDENSKFVDKDDETDCQETEVIEDIEESNENNDPHLIEEDPHSFVSNVSILLSYKSSINQVNDESNNKVRYGMILTLQDVLTYMEESLCYIKEIHALNYQTMNDIKRNSPLLYYQFYLRLLGSHIARKESHGYSLGYEIKSIYKYHDFSMSPLHAIYESISYIDSLFIPDDEYELIANNNDYAISFFQLNDLTIKYWQTCSFLPVVIDYHNRYSELIHYHMEDIMISPEIISVRHIDLPDLLNGLELPSVLLNNNHPFEIDFELPTLDLEFIDEEINLDLYSTIDYFDVYQCLFFASESLGNLNLSLYNVYRNHIQSNEGNEHNEEDDRDVELKKIYNYQYYLDYLSVCYHRSFQQSNGLMFGRRYIWKDFGNGREIFKGSCGTLMRDMQNLRKEEKDFQTNNDKISEQFQLTHRIFLKLKDISFTFVHRCLQSNQYPHEINQLYQIIYHLPPQLKEKVRIEKLSIEITNKLFQQLLHDFNECIVIKIKLFININTDDPKLKQMIKFISHMYTTDSKNKVIDDDPRIAGTFDTIYQLYNDLFNFFDDIDCLSQDQWLSFSSSTQESIQRCIDIHQLAIKYRKLACQQYLIGLTTFNFKYTKLSMFLAGRTTDLTFTNYRKELSISPMGIASCYETSFYWSIRKHKQIQQNHQHMHFLTKNLYCFSVDQLIQAWDNLAKQLIHVYEEITQQYIQSIKLNQNWHESIDNIPSETMEDLLSKKPLNLFQIYNQLHHDKYYYEKQIHSLLLREIACTKLEENWIAYCEYEEAKAQIDKEKSIKCTQESIVSLQSLVNKLQESLNENYQHELEQEIHQIQNYLIELQQELSH